MFLTYPFPAVVWKMVLQLWSVGLILHPCNNAFPGSTLQSHSSLSLHRHTTRVPGFRDSGSQWLRKNCKWNFISFKSPSQEPHILKNLFHYGFSFQLNLHIIKSASPPSTALWDTLGQGWQLKKTGLCFHCRNSLLLLTITSQQSLTANTFNMNTKFT